jgi:hypothetical protein
MVDMIDPGAGPDLRNLIQARKKTGIQPLIDALNVHWLPAATLRYNAEVGLRYFGRPSSESLPTEPKRLTEFRGRMGGLIEYAYGVTLDDLLQQNYGQDLRLSFVVASQYPDFYARNAAGEIFLKLEAKTLHDESGEYSARFDVPATQIESTDDILLYMAWQWKSAKLAGFELTYPAVIEALAVPALEIAEERDRHLALRGGHLDANNRPLVPPSNNVDSNYGKINRIVHKDRRDADDLTINVKEFLAFTQRHAAAVQKASSGSS